MIQLNDPGQWDPREGKAKRITLQVIAAIIIVLVTLFTVKQWNAPYVEQPATCDLCYGQDSVESVARDTILIPMKEGGYSSLREALDAGTQMRDTPMPKAKKMLIFIDDSIQIDVHKIPNVPYDSIQITPGRIGVKEREVETIPLKLDTEYIDTAGHTWRLHAGSTVATLPKGFPFWGDMGYAGLSSQQMGKKER
jgi:hypothetical protein